jgi:hypothetical protein
MTRAAALAAAVRDPARWPWPLPARAAWVAGWAAWAALAAAGAPAAAAWVGGAAAGWTLAWRCDGAWRRALAAAGFPLSALVLDAGSGGPAWGWAAALLPLLALYPLRSWRDAPFFPTPRGALQGLADVLRRSPPRRVLEAGCGLGHGLMALRDSLPHAELHGLEFSRPLAWACRWRCRAAGVPAQVAHGDMWAANWAGHDLVYLFQRPETMPRAAAKARAEMAPGSWLVSLEFAVPGWTPHARLDGAGTAGGRAVWVYRV